MKPTQSYLDYAKQVATECYNQIRTLTPPAIYWSWGVSRINYCYYDNDMPALELTVNGLLHKGNLLV